MVRFADVNSSLKSAFWSILYIRFKRLLLDRWMYRVLLNEHAYVKI